jgi:ABC-2 type transport system ATP-binding protein
MADGLAHYRLAASIISRRRARGTTLLQSDRELGGPPFTAPARLPIILAKFAIEDWGERLIVVRRLAVNPIEIRDLVIRYRRGWWNAPVTAVDGLSLDVAPGAVVGFLGPNGAGKSSTLKVLMGFQRPASGTARVFGHPAGSLEARRRTGFLPEVALYYPFLTPREALFLYGRVQGLAGDGLCREVEGLVEEVGLDQHQRCRLGTFSKGMLQRLGIAQALLGNPDLLILDEVTSGLDPVGRRHLRDIVLRRREHGTTIFFSSHELAEVTAMCDRIILLDQGRVVEERNLAELSQSLRRYWIRFRGTEAPAGCPFGVERDAAEGLMARFEARDEHLDGLEWLRAQGREILDVGQTEGVLEEYFVATVGGGVR